MPNSPETPPPAEHLERARALLREPGVADLTMGEALERLGLGDKAGFQALEWVVREIYYDDSEVVYAAADGEHETLDQVMARLRERFPRVLTTATDVELQISAKVEQELAEMQRRGDAKLLAAIQQDPPPRPPRRPNRRERREERRRSKREERQRQRFRNRQRVRESRA